MKIEFYGVLSDKCKIDFSKRISKNAGIVFFIATIIICTPLIIIGLIRNTYIKAFAITVVFILITIIASIPLKKRVLLYKIPIRLIIENNTISTSSILDRETNLKSKPISKIKKLIDVGDWYYIIFKFGDISNAWVCQKNLIVSGTIQEFENIFSDKIERKTVQ